MAGRLNKKTTVADFNLTIEEVEQAELGIAHDGIPIAYYVVRSLIKVTERLGIKKGIRETVVSQVDSGQRW